MSLGERARAVRFAGAGFGLRGCGPLTGEARGRWNEKLKCFLAEAAVFKLKRQDMWEEKGYWQRSQRSLD